MRSAGRQSAHRRQKYHGPVAVVIASDLAKDMAGEPLLRGVSFKLERRDRLTLSGRNGSGKTTLLRMLAGETSVDGGQLAFAKDTRVKLHDQRPPRDRDLSLRDYVLGGCGDLLALEERLAQLEHAMAEGATDAGTLDAYARAQALARARGRLYVARGRERDAARARLPRRGPRPRPGDVLRRRADPRLARPRARGRSGRCCCSTSRPTTSTSRRWSGSSRTCNRSTPPWCWWRTTAGSWRRSARPCSSSRAVAAGTSRAPGTRGARRRPRASWRSAARSRSRRRRSPRSSGSSPGSARARARARRSRASSSSGRSSA